MPAHELSSAPRIPLAVTARPVVLLQPPGACREFTRSGSVYPPLGLCQIAAVVPSDLVTVFDADGLELTGDATAAALRAVRPQLVGLTATSYTLSLVETWARVAHACGARVVVGGPHASLDPVGLLHDCPSVEAVVEGEGELVFPAIVARTLRGEPLDDLPGVHVRGRVRPVGRLVPLGQKLAIPRVEELASTPFPLVDGLPLHAYWCPDARRRPMLTMMTTRGCPHRCGFCSSPTLLGRRVRAWSVDGIVGELTRYTRILGVREVSFVDDVFSIKPARTLELCKQIVRRGLDLTWFCNARADQLSPALAEAMARAGCHQVYLGFESGSQTILDAVAKGATVAQLAHGAAVLAGAGIARSVGFVIGLPGESDATIDATIALAKRVRPERVQFTRFTPLPGTPLAAHAHSTGFHARDAADQVETWIARCYAECAGRGWGQMSW